MNLNKPFKIGLIPCLILIVFYSSTLQAQRPGWQTKEVNWKMAGKTRIKAISFPENKRPLTLEEHKLHPRTPPRKKLISSNHVKSLLSAAQPSAAIYANVIDSPPIDGFVPWIVISATNADEGELVLDAYPNIGVTGQYPAAIDPATDYAIGIFDTGASAHVMGYDNAITTGLYSGNLVTSATVLIGGATGSVDARVSFPLGLFIDGLGAIDSNGHLSDGSYMIGETNVSICVGQSYTPDLFTAIGTPLSVYFAADVSNDHPLTLTRNSESFVSQDIHFYDIDDPCVPVRSHQIILELRPADGVAVQYFPCVPMSEDDCPDGEYSPMSPSTITGFLPTQSLFFIPGIDLYEGSKSAIEKQNFIIDTGAQISVISTYIANRLALSSSHPDFEVEVVGVDGTSIMAPGYYLDAVDIPTSNEYLSFTNVPVVKLDIDSPEGGYLDGIIGMNLFVDLNFVFNGGGLPSQFPAYIDFDFLPPHIPGDVAPGNGDWAVNYIDLAAFTAAWLATPTSPNWDDKCNLAPPANPDQIINFLDFAVMASHWMEQTIP